MAAYDTGDIAITSLSMTGHVLIKLRDKGILSNDDVNDIMRAISADVAPGRKAAVDQLMNEAFNFK